MNDEEQKGDNNFIFVSANYDLKEKDMDGKHDTLEVTYEDLNDALEVSEDDSCSSEEKDIKGEHPSPDMNVELALEDEESSHEGTASPGIFFPDGCGSNAEVNEELHDYYEECTAKETDISTLEISVKNVNLIDKDDGVNVEESETVNEEFKGQTRSSLKSFMFRSGPKLEKLIYVRKVVSNFSKYSKNCSVTVFKQEFDDKLKLKVDGVNMLVTVTSLQTHQLNDIPANDFKFDTQLICDVNCNLKNHKLFSFPWRPGNLRCWIYIFTIIDMVLLLMSVVCALFANTVKAKLEAEEFEEELYRGKPLVRNLKQSMAYLFPVQLTKPVEYETEVYKVAVYEELSDDSVVTNVAYKSVMYDAVVYEELLDESMVETVAYEAMVYDEMSLFPTRIGL